MAAMAPITFGGRFGWLHRPVDRQAQAGVVLVPAIGRDARCGHRPMRLLADQLAAAGFATLRYDHRGTGDSLDLAAPEGEALAEWRRGVREAAQTLREQTGVSRLVLGGLRLGASLAAAEAAEADGLILLAPVLSGRSWLRRLRFAFAAKGEAAPGDADPLDADGLVLSPATALALAELDLARLAPFPGPVLIAAQNRLVQTHAARMAGQGARVTALDFPGFDELYLDAHSNLEPQAVFDGVLDWITGAFAEAGLAAAPAARSPDGPAVLRPPGVIEQAVVLDGGLQGVVCAPEAGAAKDRAVLFCNTGGDPRAGIGGFATEAARTLARRGIVSLRFDFAGLGDSPWPPATPRCHVYETPRGADMKAALDFLEAQGQARVDVVGVCAGAFHAVETAVRDPRVAGVFGVSPVKQVWRPGDSLIFTRKDDGKATKLYARALGDAGVWRRLLRGQVDVAAVARTLAARLAERLAGIAARNGPDAPLARMKAISRRGGRARLIMGLDDASVDALETWFGPGGRGLTRLPQMSLQILPALDHGLARSASRRLALEQLLDWIAADEAAQASRT